MRFIPPVESMRVGGLPAGYRGRPRDQNESVRDLIGGSEHHDATKAYPAVRTCRCGAQVLRGSPADREHRAECGEPEEPEQPDTGGMVLPQCAAGCGRTANYGALFCSPQCSKKARG